MVVYCRISDSKLDFLLISSHYKDLPSGRSKKVSLPHSKLKLAMACHHACLTIIHSDTGFSAGKPSLLSMHPQSTIMTQDLQSVAMEL